MEQERTGGMTAIAVLNIIFGGVGILNGLYLALGSFVLMYELLRLDVFAPVGARIEPCVRFIVDVFVRSFLLCRPHPHHATS